MSNPSIMEGIINSNPMLRQMVDANPQMRSVLGNPALMQQMMSPQNLQVGP
jgi:ubiquilin